MLKGLALTPPVIGRISIGRVVERDGKRLPEKDDGFTITTQIQSKDGWIKHPLDASLRKSPDQKLRSIPVRLLFDDPDLSFRANYTMFDRSSGRPLCVGDGQNCRRATSAGFQTLPCPTPMSCTIGIEGHCKPYGRLHVRIGGDDELGCFVFRTTGFNSIRTLMTRLRYFQAVSGDKLSCMRLELKLRGKSTALSHRAPIYYVDLTIPQGSTLADIVREACEEQERRIDSGLRQDLLEQAAQEGLALGAFEESDEEGLAVVEEFYPQDGGSDPLGSGSSASGEQTSAPHRKENHALAAKLRQRNQMVNAKPE
ncbi:hypothetical protein ACFQNJ_01345 [Hydrogenophaga bisanensis]|uniref:Hydrolase or metal-binding protein n=1 Tax=Hydrogenophaga bisanensis TaxID=439611 RepID=A0ABW2R4M7_9BURK